MEGLQGLSGRTFGCDGRSLELPLECGLACLVKPQLRGGLCGRDGQCGGQVPHAAYMGTGDGGEEYGQ